MDSYYKQQAQIYSQRAKKLEKTNPTAAKNNRNLALQYLDLNKKYMQTKKNQDSLNKILNRGIPSDEDVAEEYKEIEMQSKLQDAESDNVKLDDVKLDDVKLDDVKLDDVKLDDVKLDNVKSDNVKSEDMINENNSDNSSLLLDVKSPNIEPRSPPRNLQYSASPSPSINPRTSFSSTSSIPVLNNLGFTESLKPLKRTSVSKKNFNKNICSNIFMNGLNVNADYFYPSEFPNLTKIKSLPIIDKKIKKGGKRTRKNKSKKRKIKQNRI